MIQSYNQCISTGSNTAAITPATIVDLDLSNEVNKPSASVPRAIGTYKERDPEEVERERGNTEFKSGNFSAAVKSYTKCLGMKVIGIE